jgi:hypothetical protein
MSEADRRNPRHILTTPASTAALEHETRRLVFYEPDKKALV